jgi:hypothetical protein
MRGCLWLATVMYSAGLCAQTDPLTLVQAQRAADAKTAAAEQRGAGRADQTQALLQRYRSAIWQTQQLRGYVHDLEPILKQQAQSLATLQAQAQERRELEPQLVPLMLQMIDSLARFVALDLPFLRAERQERIDALRRVMTDPASPLAEKFRRIAEAYRIEADYGRSWGAEDLQITVDSSEHSVSVLRVGRVVLLYVTPDGRDSGYWDAALGRWVSLGGRDARRIQEGVRIARELKAPTPIVLPVPVPHA